jgi:NTE family protein
MQQSEENRKIGLALGGGFALGAAHIGVLRAIDELRIPIHCIAGTSIGAFVAALHAFGVGWKELRSTACDLNWLDAANLSLSRYGLLTNDGLGEILDATIGEVDLAQAATPLAIVTTDITNGEKVVLRAGGAAGAVMASTAIPGLFAPYEWDGQFLADGGMTENVPIAPLKAMGADFIIAVDLISAHAASRPDNIVDVLVNAVTFTIQRSTKRQVDQADVWIAPDLSSFNWVDATQITDMLDVGYEAAKNELQELVATINRENG